MSNKQILHEQENEALQEAATDAMQDADDGFFDFQICADLYVQLSHDLFGEILSWIPAYPYLYSLRRVCKKWKRELEERIYEQRVELLDLLESDRRMDEHKGYRNFVDFTEVQVDLPVDESGDTAAPQSNQKKGKHDGSRTKLSKPKAFITRASVIECLGTCFPNVKTLRIQLDAGLYEQNYSQLVLLLRQFPRLEHLLVLIMPLTRCNFQEFVSRLASTLQKKSHLQSLTIVGLQISEGYSGNTWLRIAKDLSSLESLPHFQKLELKYSAADARRIDWKLASPVKNLATGAVQKWDCEDQMLEYCSYMLEKLRIPYDKMLFRERFSVELDALDFAIDRDMSKLVRFLLPLYKKPMREGLYDALCKEFGNSESISSLLLDNEVNLGSDLLELLKGVVRFGYDVLALQRIMAKITRTQIQYDRLLDVFKFAVSQNSTDVIQYFIDNHLEALKHDENGFRYLLFSVSMANALHSDRLTTTVQLLVNQGGLSLRSCNQNQTFMFYLLGQILSAVVDRKVLNQVFLFLQRSPSGGLASLLSQQVTSDSPSALRIIIQRASLNFDDTSNGQIATVVSLAEQATQPAFWRLHEEKSGISFLQLFANTTMLDCKSQNWYFAKFLASRFVAHCDTADVRAVLKTACNSLLFKEFLRRNPNREQYQDVIDAQMRRVLDDPTGGKHAVLFSLLADTDALFDSLVKYIVEKYYGNDLLNLLVLRDQDEEDTVFHVLAAGEFSIDARVKRIRMLLEACGNARKDQRIVNLVNLKNKQGDTALHIAVRQECEEIACALINHGADINAKNAQRKTPMDCAKLKQLRTLQSVVFDPSKKYVQEPKNYVAKKTLGSGSASQEASAAAALPAPATGRRGRKRQQQPSQGEEEQSTAGTSSGAGAAEADVAAPAAPRRKRIRLDKQPRYDDDNSHR